MIFGEIQCDKAQGVVLAHTIRLSPASVFKKGRVLSLEDCQTLLQAGISKVMAARLENFDASEDIAAARIAEAITGPNITLTKATTGRANGHASAQGLLLVSPERLNAMNLIDEAITIATLSPFSAVDVGAMVHTVKIIPFAVSNPLLETAIATASEGATGQWSGPCVSVAPFQKKRVALILTKLPGTRDELLENAHKAQATRVARLGSHLIEPLIVKHEIESVKQALGEVLKKGIDLVLALGASAIVDRKDVLPSAIIAAGGLIEHFGMPVDPGNLILIGRVGNAHIIGVPGCARSLKRSGFDWVLERIFANIEITRTDIMKMGCGGLLAEIPGRPLPRVGAAPPSAAPSNVEAAPPSAAPSNVEAAPPSAAPRVHAIVLAAGLSRRMGGVNKLLAPIDGAAHSTPESPNQPRDTAAQTPMVRHVVNVLLASNVSGVSVVLGHQSDLVRAALAGSPVTFIENRAFEEGLGASLRAGIENVPMDVDAALIALGDMPLVRPEHINAILAGFDPDSPHTICIPVHDRKRGHPVLWSRRHFAEMRALGGDVGARVLLEKHAESIKTIPISDSAIYMDVDTPDMLNQIAPPRSP